MKKTPTAVDVNGADYRAVVRLSDKGGATVAESGETCERVNPASLPWLIEQRLIVPVEKDDAV